MHLWLSPLSRALFSAPLAVAALLVAVSGPGPARATTLVPLAVEDMTQISSDVVLGKVSRVTCEYSADRSQIFTYVTVTADQRLKGEGGARQTFVLWGGRVGDDVLQIEGSPQFAAGEQVLVFLGQLASRTPLTQPTDRWLLGLGNGKWSVTTDVATGQTIARSSVAGAERAMPLARLTASIATAIHDADSHTIRGRN